MVIAIDLASASSHRTSDSVLKRAEMGCEDSHYNCCLMSCLSSNHSEYINSPFRSQDEKSFR